MGVERAGVCHVSIFTLAAGTIEGARAHLKMVFPQFDIIACQLARADCEIDRLSAALARPALSSKDEPAERGQRDVEILSSLPGVGRIVLATLLAEAQGPLQRRDYQALQ